MLDEPLRQLVAAALAKDSAARPPAQQLLLGLVGRREEAGGPTDDGEPGCRGQALRSRAVR
jgi:hypothetical protein